MSIQRKRTSPRYQRDAITSYLLVSPRTAESQHLTVTLVDMAPGGKQHVHAHEPEQCYFILEGNGEMTVDDECSPVQAGDCIFIPSGSRHGLVNTGGTLLRYLSAAAPSFTPEQLVEHWPMPSEAEEQGLEA